MDESKDQTYFLFGLTQEQLSRTDFPLGELSKHEVRDIARRLQVPVAEKPESQEICFVPSGNYVKFIEGYLQEQGSELPDDSGDIVSTSGEVLGRHNGLRHYTVGQRRGLGIAGGRPMYVVALDRARNRLVIGEDQELRATICEVRDVNWIPFACPDAPVEAMVRIRNRHEPAAAEVTPLDASHGARHLPRTAARHHSGAGRRILFRRESAWRRLDPLISAKFHLNICSYCCGPK